ncbi:MAG TPA: DUF554 domain-containing protein [Planctomycetota bacterium]
MHWPLGTLINIGCVLAGTTVGLLVGRTLPARFKETTMAVNGMVTLALGFKMAAETHNFLVMLVAVVLGGIIGEVCRIDDGLQALGRWLEQKAGGIGPAPLPAGTEAGATTQESKVAAAFVTASLIFCVGPITILGSIQDGLSGDYQLLAIKSFLDLITSLTLATTLGWGVGLSILTIAVLQGGLSVCSSLLSQSAGGFLAGKTISAGTQLLPLGGAMIGEMTAAGGILLVGTGLLLLDIKRPRVANLLPAIALAPAIVLLLYALKISLAPAGPLMK